MKNKDKILAHLSADPVFKPLVKTLDPLSLEASGNVYHELVKNIVYQQISYKAADSIFGRLVNCLGSEHYQPYELLNREFDTLRSCGLSQRKTEYIRGISEFFIEERLMEFPWSDYRDEEIIELLTRIRGVGRWTVKMILIFQLHRPDVFPHEDLAIRQAMASLYGLNDGLKSFVSTLDKIAEAWRPYRTAASLYLWAYRRAQIAGKI